MIVLEKLVQATVQVLKDNNLNIIDLDTPYSRANISVWHKISQIYFTSKMLITVNR